LKRNVKTKLPTDLKRLPTEVSDLTVNDLLIIFSGYRGFDEGLIEFLSIPVFKRSVDPSEKMFAEFAGKEIIEYDISNLSELEEYEARR